MRKFKLFLNNYILVIESNYWFVLKTTTINNNNIEQNWLFIIYRWHINTFRSLKKIDTIIFLNSIFKQSNFFKINLYVIYNLDRTGYLYIKAKTNFHTAFFFFFLSYNINYIIHNNEYPCMYVYTYNINLHKFVIYFFVFICLALYDTICVL
jgi:hypothetical protein